MTEQERVLKRLGSRRATLQRRQRELGEEIRAAALNARDAGVSAPKIAAALGVTHQAVYQMLAP